MLYNDPQNHPVVILPDLLSEPAMILNGSFNDKISWRFKHVCNSILDSKVRSPACAGLAHTLALPCESGMVPLHEKHNQHVNINATEVITTHTNI